MNYCGCFRKHLTSCQTPLLSYRPACCHSPIKLKDMKEREESERGRGHIAPAERGKSHFSITSFTAPRLQWTFSGVGPTQACPVPKQTDATTLTNSRLPPKTILNSCVCRKSERNRFLKVIVFSSQYL